MGVFDFFRRPQAISTLTDLDDFLDSHAAFMVQKCVIEYARARSGLLWEKLFKEPAFKAALDRSRWANFPLCLENLTRMVAVALRPQIQGPQAVSALTGGLAASARRIVARYPVPDGMADDFWASAGDSIEAALRTASLAAPKPVKDLPKDTMNRFFAHLPIHESLRGHDYVLIQNNLRLNLCRAYETFIERADEAALAAALAAPDATPEATKSGAHRG